jgi:uncharacterized membrane protein YeiH
MYFGRNCIFMLKKFNLDNDILYLITSLVIISVRLMAVKFEWYLPTLEKIRFVNLATNKINIRIRPAE